MDANNLSQQCSLPVTQNMQHEMLLSNDPIYLLGLMDTIDSNDSNDDFDGYCDT